MAEFDRKAGFAPAGALPTYALYGEQGRTQATDWLHCERIAERSQRHDWEIRPHRHASLYQILHLQRGSATAWLESGSQALTGPCVLLMPALVPHGFVFSPAVEGTTGAACCRAQHRWSRG
jgi:AraC family transcriptional activator of pobA